MHRPTKVEALPGFRLHLLYPDDKEGVIDLSNDVGCGVFTALADEAFFRTVHIGQFGQIAWSQDIEICPDSACDDRIILRSQAPLGNKGNEEIDTRPSAH